LSLVSDSCSTYCVRDVGQVAWPNQHQRCAEMSSVGSGDALRLKKVSVDFDGAIHFFRIVPNYTFANLLSDSAKHWQLEEDEYELQDEDGSTWPSSGALPPFNSSPGFSVLAPFFSPPNGIPCCIRNRCRCTLSRTGA